jgi:hypothetical protein
MQARRTPQHVFMAPVWEKQSATHLDTKKAARQLAVNVEPALQTCASSVVTASPAGAESGVGKGDFRVEFAVVSGGFGQR